jgi:hypothetical protein
MEIMRHFGEATGMRISISKSSVVPIRCAEVNLDQVLQSFQGERATLPITYLGLPITLNKVKMAQLQPILDSAALKLDGWQANLLNIGGRRELVRSVLGSLPTYLLSSNHLSASTRRWTNFITNFCGLEVKPFMGASAKFTGSMCAGQ